MPVRIKPNRVGYNGYRCVGIPQPCISPMDSSTNRFECLPKSAIKMVCTTPFVNLEDLLGSAGSGTHYDPLNNGIFVDLYGRFVSGGHGGVIDQGCGYEYNCIVPGSFPQDSQSKRQIQAQPGFMDPPSTGIDAIGSGPPVPEVVSSGGSSGGSGGSGAQISVQVVTDMELNSLAVLRWKTRVIYVDNADAEEDWAPVPGWLTTDCNGSYP